MTTISRRAWLKGFGAIAGASMASRFIGEASAAPAGKAAVVSIYLEGGFNALFASADSFASSNLFGCTASNVANLGNGLVVDKATIGSLPAWALGHMAAIGVRHGATDHINAQRNNFMDGASSNAVKLAAAIGGGAAFKAVALGGLPVPGPSMVEGGVSHQLLRTMEDVESALGLGAQDASKPKRADSAKALIRAQQMSQRAIDANPRSLSFAKDAFATDIDALQKPPAKIDAAEIRQAYGVGGGELGNVASKLAAAEQMLRGGTNVITLSDQGWDTHGDRAGASVRRQMTSNIIPALNTFLTRLKSDAELNAMNVSVVIHGDFARSLPSSDHAPALSALVIGPNVKLGTTGKVSASVTLKDGTGGGKEMWAYLAAIAKVQNKVFGNNPHDLVL
ncbi:MAG: DUF1501 domain-containing protein [Labilithrix sp.]